MMNDETARSTHRSSFFVLRLEGLRGQSRLVNKLGAPLVGAVGYAGGCGYTRRLRGVQRGGRFGAYAHSCGNAGFARANRRADSRAAKPTPSRADSAPDRRTDACADR